MERIVGERQGRAAVAGSVEAVRFVAGHRGFVVGRSLVNEAGKNYKGFKKPSGNLRRGFCHGSGLLPTAGNNQTAGVALVLVGVVEQPGRTVDLGRCAGSAAVEVAVALLAVESIGLLVVLAPWISRGWVELPKDL